MGQLQGLRQVQVAQKDLDAKHAFMGKEARERETGQNHSHPFNLQLLH